MEVRDGADIDSVLLARLPTADGNLRFIQSTGNTMRLYFNSVAEYHSGRGFLFSYHQGVLQIKLKNHYAVKILPFMNYCHIPCVLLMIYFRLCCQYNAPFWIGNFSW